MNRKIQYGLIAAGLLATSVALVSRSARVSEEALEFHWQANTRYVYSIDYVGNQVSQLPNLAGVEAPNRRDASISGASHISGEVSLVVRGKRNGNTLLGWSLPRIDRFEGTINGQTALSVAYARDAFANREVLMEVSPSGEVVDIGFGADAPELVMFTAQMLIGETQVRLSEQYVDSWRVEEFGHHGESAPAYTVLSRDRTVVKLAKAREAYSSFRSLPWVPKVAELVQDVEYTASIELEPGGPLRSLEAHESIQASDGALSLLAMSVDTSMHLLRTEKVAIAARRPDSRRWYGLGKAIPSALAEQSALQDQIGDLTWRDVESGILAFGTLGPRPDHHEWRWRTRGLLKQQKELCYKLVALFDHESASLATRNLILDLLSGTGHDVAQKAMIAILSSETAQESELAYVGYVQRMSHVLTPTEESATFLQGEYQRSEGDIRTASAYSLGAVVSNLSANKALAKQVNQELINALGDASEDEDASEQVRLLGALSNAGVPDNVEAISEFTRSSSMEVRAATATALRKTQTRLAEQTLLKLVTDTSATVRKTALATLDSYDLPVEQRQQLGARVLRGFIAPAQYHLVLDTIAGLPSSAYRLRVLNYMLNKSGGDLQIRGRIQSHLGLGANGLDS